MLKFLGIINFKAMRKIWGVIYLFAALLFLSGCMQTDDVDNGHLASRGTDANDHGTGAENVHNNAQAPKNQTSDLISPSGIKYLGAFRLPEPSGGSNWMWSGYAVTYYPDGNPGGADDGFPGSIFATGHDHHQMVSEISIPRPIISKDPEKLNTAETIQPFSDIRGDGFGEQEMPRAGLAYLPAKGDRPERIYFAWGEHLEDSNHELSHGYASTDLSNPSSEGPWYLGNFNIYTVNDYMFAIPPEWAEHYIPSARLATGRFRDGLWAGRGPALYAIPAYDESCVDAETISSASPLLLYGQQDETLGIRSDESMQMQNFSEADEWSGAVWLAAGGNHAVAIIGTKALGKTWYGFSNGVEWPITGDEGEEYPEVPEWPYDQRGWWSEDIDARILLYDSSDLAAVAAGDMETWEPQPYASVSINEYLLDPGYDYERGKMYSLGAAAFDLENGILYIFERMAGEDEKSIVHVFSVN
jgi:hypothetical protein